MAVTSSDKLLLGSALMLVIASVAGFGTLAMRHQGVPSGPPPKVELADSPYTPIAPDAPPIKTETWNPPVAQSRGREWIYDTFTPPEIFYNPRSKQFSVKPPTGLGEDEVQEVYGLELVAVHPEPFRLQLIGYVGGEGNWRGMFQNIVSGEVFLGSSGLRLPKLGLSIQRLEVTPQPITLPESMTTRQRVATAVIHDERTNRDVTITHRERAFTGTVFAFVSVAGETAEREVRTGDSFKIGDATYRIDKVQTTPPQIEVTKEAPTLTQPDHRVLTPRETETPEGAEAPETTPK